MNDESTFFFFFFPLTTYSAFSFFIRLKREKMKLRMLNQSQKLQGNRRISYLGIK